MSPKRIMPRNRAIQGIDEAVDYYLSEAGEKAALGFIDALEQACRHIVRLDAARPGEVAP